MMRNLKHTFLLAGLSAWLLASTAWAQQPGAQYVDSLEEHQQRIEGLLRERLTAMLPTGNYVLKVFVIGERARVPATRAEPPARSLPGFHPADGESLRSGGEEK
ncbi:MAG: hypothetical protein IID17_00915, partial [Nitrospinae bacterium]|nr:hypothetical protein [Nitrospinota bacterium]